MQLQEEVCVQSNYGGRRECTCATLGSVRVGHSSEACGVSLIWKLHNVRVRITLGSGHVFGHNSDRKCAVPFGNEAGCERVRMHKSDGKCVCVCVSI